MRTAGYGLLISLGILSLAWLLDFPQARADRTSPTADRTSPTADRGSGDGLVVMPLDLADGRQQVTIVDTKTRVMAVYHVDKVNGGLALRSVRNVHWDLLMEEYNTSTGTPSPRDIRALAEQR